MSTLAPEQATRKPWRVDYEPGIEEAVEGIVGGLSGRYPLTRRSVALLLLQEDPDIVDLVRTEEGDRFAVVAKTVHSARSNLGDTIGRAIATQYRESAHAIAQRALIRSRAPAVPAVPAPAAEQSVQKPAKRKSVLNARTVLLGLSAFMVLAVIVWQALAAHGIPDPAARNLSPAAVTLSSAVLVFREGLEAILVLAAVTAGLTRSRQAYGRGVALGAGLAFLATVATWFIAVGIISEVNAPELHIPAATGLLAIVVLLVVMNWFFHKVYWTGWIAHHNNRRRRLLEAKDTSSSRTFWGLALLGFTAIYREGFEVVLFLQNLRLKAGTGVVLNGTAIGLILTGMVAVLTFVAHRHLPYKKMLVLTGALLAGVLIVMVGESVQELQLAGWLSTTPLPLPLPGWIGMWLAVFPNVEGLVAQGVAGLLVFGSYFSAQYLRVWRPQRRQEAGPSLRKAW